MPRLDRSRSLAAQRRRPTLEALEGRVLLSRAAVRPPGATSNPLSNFVLLSPDATGNFPVVGSTGASGAHGGPAALARKGHPASRLSTAHPAVLIQPQLTNAPSGYTPGQVRHAYGVDGVSLDGSGQTIAVIDAFDDPTIGRDLRSFDAQFGLPDTTLLKAVPTSGTPSYDAGWASEIALDVEWAHAEAPGAKILLVEAKSGSVNDLLSAVDYAVAQGASQVSMSWGSSDVLSSSLEAHFRHPGVSFFSAAGDSGSGQPIYPSASAYVTSVGGTTLGLDGSGNRGFEQTWSQGGGGRSTSISRPSYQTPFASGRRRSMPDVAFNADPNTGFAVYDSSSGAGWFAVGGTSAGAPQWAGIVALANEGRANQGKAPVGSGTTYGTNQVLYTLAGGSGYSNPNGDFHDITSGSNGYAATGGYDLATGLGTPNASKLVPDLINS